MALVPGRPRGDHDETAHVVRHFARTLDRVLGFLGYTIHDVVNDPRRREHVRRAYILSLRIDRDLAREPWREWRRGSGGHGPARPSAPFDESAGAR